MEFVDDYNVYSNDYNEDLIYLWNSVKDDRFFTECPVISKYRYLELKEQKEQTVEKCFAMFYCTFMNMYKGAYAIHRERDDVGERYRSIIKVQETIKKIKQFTDYDYKTFDFSDGGHIVYLDPPYSNTLQPYKKEMFNTEEFWKCAKKWKDQGNYVFISEQSCPIDHIVVFQKNITNNFNPDKKIQEKIFMLN